MAGVEGHVGTEEEAQPLEEGALDPGGLAPKEAVVDEEDLRPGSPGPADALGAGVHGEGHELYRAAGAADLYSVERVVDPAQRIYLEKGAAPAVEVQEFHGCGVYREGIEKKKGLSGKEANPERPWRDPPKRCCHEEGRNLEQLPLFSLRKQEYT